MNNEYSQTFNSLALMGLKSIKQDTVTHNSNQVETNQLVESLSKQVDHVEIKVDKLNDSVQQLNSALSNLINSQTQINHKFEDLTNKIDKVWQERWWYRIFPLSILGVLGIGIWQIISNWDNIVNFFTAMNAFFQQAK